VAHDGGYDWTRAGVLNGDGSRRARHAASLFVAGGAVCSVADNITTGEAFVPGAGHAARLTSRSRGSLCCTALDRAAARLVLHVATHPGAAVTAVLIDTDPGIDDAVAIMFALKAGLDVKGLPTVSGNLRPTVRCHARKVLELMRGTAYPWRRAARRRFVPVPRTRSRNGTTGWATPGPRPRLPIDKRSHGLIVEPGQRVPGDLWCGTGPLTNVALALMKIRTCPESWPTFT